MKRFMLVVVIGAFALGAAVVPAPGQGVPARGTCESKAVDKNGKPLVGAAKNSFMAKCKREACEAPAAAAEQEAPEGQSDLQKSVAPQVSEKATPPPTAQAPQTTGRSSSHDAAVEDAAQESKSAAEARRVRAAVARTLRRTHELFRSASQ